MRYVVLNGLLMVRLDRGGVRVMDRPRMGYRMLWLLWLSCRMIDDGVAIDQSFWIWNEASQVVGLYVYDKIRDDIVDISSCC